MKPSLRAWVLLALIVPMSVWVLQLAPQRPVGAVEASVQQPPLPVKDGIDETFGDPPMEEQLLKYAFEQGVLGVTLLIVGGFYRRDMKDKEAAAKADRDARIADRDERIAALKQDIDQNALRERHLIEVIQGNTRALAESAEAKNRLARAVEHMNQRYRRDDHRDDGEDLAAKRRP